MIFAFVVATGFVGGVVWAVADDDPPTLGVLSWLSVAAAAVLSLTGVATWLVRTYHRNAGRPSPRQPDKSARWGWGYVGAIGGMAIAQAVSDHVPTGLGLSLLAAIWGVFAGFLAGGLWLVREGSR